MDRRTFLKLAGLTPLYLSQIAEGVTAAEQPVMKFTAATPRNFELLEVKGSYQQIGYEIGKQFKRNIFQIIKRRSRWHTDLLAAKETSKGKMVSKELMKLTKKHFPSVLEEIRGMAEGAGIDFEHMWAMCIKSELAALGSEPPGCSSIFLKDQDRLWLFQNEDGHSAYRDLMFMVKVTPPSGVRFMSMVYPGIITGNGPSMNDRGVVQTTNYIGSTRSEIGIPRYVIGRAILEAKSAAEAVDIATIEPRAYPYHHHIAGTSDHSYFSVETTPDASQVKEPKGFYCHTNHLLFEKTREYEHQDKKYRSTSSMPRYRVLEKRLLDQVTAGSLKTRPGRAGPGKPEDFLGILSSHEKAPYSPCRHPEGDVQGTTLGTAFFDLNKGSFRLYKGNPCEAARDMLYTEFGFS